MSLQDWGSIGELLGAVATLLTLAYLAIQVRQNSLQMREATRVAKTEAMSSTVEAFSRYRSMLTQAGNAELYIRGLASYAELNEVDKIRFKSIVEEYFFAYAAMFERLEAGTYESATWEIQMQAAASVIRNPGGAQWWEERKNIYGHAFVSQMESSGLQNNAS